MLTSGRLCLRAWREEDLAPFASLNADPRVMRFMPRRLSAAESDAFARALQGQIAARGWGVWAVEVKGTGEFIGCVGLAQPTFTAHFTPCHEVLWRLNAQSWGQGYASEAAERCLDFAFGPLALEEVVAFTAAVNEPSRAVMRRLGMRQTAADDFEHPRLPPGDPLRPHVLARMSGRDWTQRPPRSR
jgi:RimJ/RimL family protein N-acetyltransferase